MAINETVHTRVTADASQAVGAFRRVEGALGSVGKAARESSSSSNDFFSGITGGLMKFNLALGGIEKGLGLVKDAIGLAKFSVEMEKLEKAVPTAVLDALRVASRGLATDMDLLRAANAAMRGDFALSGDEMVTMTRAATVLAAQTLRPLAEVMNILTDATRGKTRALDDLTVNFEKTGDQVKDKIALFRKFNEIIGDAAPFDAQAENLTRMTTTWENQLNQIKSDLGEVAEVLLVIIEPITALAGVVAKLLKWAGRTTVEAAKGAAYVLTTNPLDIAAENARGFGGGRQAETARAIEAERARRVQTYGEGQLAQEDYDRLADEASTMMSALAPAIADPVADAVAQALADFDMQQLGWSIGPEDMVRSPDIVAGPTKAAPKKTKTKTGRRTDTAGAPIGFMPPSTFHIDPGISMDELFVGGSAMGMGPSQSAQQAAIDAQLELQMATFNATQAYADQVEVLAQLSDQTTLAGGAYAVFGGAMSAAIDAAIMGNESIGTAALKAVASVLRGIAQESAVKALFEVAQGWAAFAIGSPTAIGHFKASAAFAATATAAGVGAAALYSATGSRGGPGGSSAGAAGGGYSSPGSRSGSGGGDTIIVQVGDGFVGDAHALAEEIDRKVRAGKRAGIVRDGQGAVTFS
mgnify:CR=1 FL=1